VEQVAPTTQTALRQLCQILSRTTKSAISAIAPAEESLPEREKAVAAVTTPCGATGSAHRQTERRQTDSCHLAGKAARTGWQTNWRRLSGVQHSVRGMCCACLLQSSEAFCCWLACLHGYALTRSCRRPSASVPFTAGYITALTAGWERLLLRMRQAAAGLQVSTNPSGERDRHSWQQQQRPVMFMWLCSCRCWNACVCVHADAACVRC
jgi:hypothetical protein